VGGEWHTCCAARGTKVSGNVVTAGAC
jgi:hypothetical protein